MLIKRKNLNPAKLDIGDLVTCEFYQSKYRRLVIRKVIGIRLSLAHGSGFAVKADGGGHGDWWGKDRPTGWMDASWFVRFYPKRWKHFKRRLES